MKIKGKDMMENVMNQSTTVNNTQTQTIQEQSRYCFTSTEDCIHSRRCFMTGEYCSKQTNIQRERKKLHDEKCINAFVVMNFSNMSDVVYKWRLKRFVESLTKYLYIDKEDEKLYCFQSVKLPKEKRREMEQKKLERINKIHVIRADSDPASNYVICNRVCQQMQIADLIIVDVSTENTNVFYEFGMAVALGKMILPICYSESFYEMSIPEKIKHKTESNQQDLEHHIDCYPWRRKLFEYYGIRYKSGKSHKENVMQKENCMENDDDSIQPEVTKYLPFEEAKNKDYGFTDMQYDRFPYHEHIKGFSENIGKEVYSVLARSYNDSEYEHNTLIVYTMDGFLNEPQAGQCILNFYNNITKQMKEEHCFCGERVGVLVQTNSISEDVKDARTEKNLLYSVGEIIHIGINQATYVAMEEKIKTKDFLEVPNNLKESSPEEEEIEWETEIQRFVKEHIRNKGILVYPNNPVYVNRVKNGLQKDILKNHGNSNSDFSFEHFFCLYHVMLRTLKYTNEIAVDVSKNSLQSLFWLGAAHGSDIYAIMVQHEETNKEREITSTFPEKKERPIFDVAGLWSAVLRSYDTEGFYQQITLAQLGIERHTKLMLKNPFSFEERLRKYLKEIKEQSFDKDVRKILEEKKEEEIHILESYYRNCFWKPMLRYNRLWIYLPQVDAVDSDDGEPRLHMVKWDVEAIAAISHYLSKRKMIGEYRFKPLGEDEFDEKAPKVNFICVGNDARPLQNPETGQKKKTESLAEYIQRHIESAYAEYDGNCNIIHEHWEKKFAESCLKRKWMYRGFRLFKDKSSGIFAQFPQSDCAKCVYEEKEISACDFAGDAKIYHSIEEIEHAKRENCEMKNSKSHVQLAQLILWREIGKDRNDRVYFRVALTGVSGPATYGLSTIFVDDDQKEKLYGKENPLEDRNLLNKLQERIREKLIDIYLKKLQKELESINEEFSDVTDEQIKKKQKEYYFRRVKYAAVAYLSTVFYRYFLPFLSIEDEYRICNGMRTYVASMMAAKTSPFSLNYPSDGDVHFNTSVHDKFVEAAAESVNKALEIVLRDFRGVEAFYEVTVKIENKKNTENEENQKCDSRKVLGIRELQDDTRCVNCIFGIKD